MNEFDLDHQDNVSAQEPEPFLETMFQDISDAREAKRLLEALLFSSRDPLTVEDLKDALPETFDINQLLLELQAEYEGRGFVLENNGIFWGFRTASDLADRLAIERIEVKKLSRAGLETLAIIAYHQPVSRAEIENIRGVAVAKGTIDSLLELGWIKPRGRKAAPGRPLMWGTTDEFLDHFGLTEVKELPGIKELEDSGLLGTTFVGQGIEAEDTEQGLEAEDTEQGLEAEDTEQGLEREDTEQGLEREDTEQGLEREDTEQGLEREDTEQGLEREDTEQGLEREDTEQGLEREDQDMDEGQDDNVVSLHP